MVRGLRFRSGFARSTCLAPSAIWELRRSDRPGTLTDSAVPRTVLSGDRFGGRSSRCPCQASARRMNTPTSASQTG